MKDNLFDGNDIESLVKLADLFTSADTENKIYRVSPASYDYFVELIGKNRKLSKEEKKRFLEKIDIRRRNQNRIEAISLEAKDITRAEKLLGSNEHER